MKLDELREALKQAPANDAPTRAPACARYANGVWISEPMINSERGKWIHDLLHEYRAAPAHTRCRCVKPDKGEL